MEHAALGLAFGFILAANLLAHLRIKEGVMYLDCPRCHEKSAIRDRARGIYCKRCRIKFFPDFKGFVERLRTVPDTDEKEAA